MGRRSRRSSAQLRSTIELTIHPATRAEYEAAVDWYAQHSTLAASQFTSEVEEAIEAIQSRPGDHARLNSIHPLYLLDKFPYYIAYRFTDEQVTIVAIRHTSRDDTWLER